MTTLRHRRRRRSAAFAKAGVIRATWLGEDTVLFTHSARPAPGKPRAESFPARFREFQLERGTTWLWAARLPASSVDRARAKPIRFRARDDELTVDPQELRGALTDLQTMVREELAGADAATRHDVLGFLATLPGSLSDHGRLSPGLRRTREMLRERHPIACDERRPGSITVDSACRIDSTYVFIQGAIDQPEEPIDRLAALSPEGELIDLSELVEPARSEQSPRRFAGLFTVHSSTDEGWVLTAHRDNGTAIEAPELDLVSDVDMARRAVIAARARMSAESGDHTMADRAIEILQRRRRERALPATIERLGTPPQQPAVSIALALGRDAELLEHHLVQLATQREVGNCELIAALDGPADPEREHWRIAQLYELYRIPLTVTMTQAAAGSGLLRAVADEVALAPRLLLMKGGVLPASGGWLATLLAFRDALDGGAALAPKLVRPDATIQDAGYTFAAGPTDGWTPQPRLTGAHELQPAVNITRTVPAARATCLLVDRNAHAEASQDVWRYVTDLGADLELSLRLGSLGHPVWHVPRAVVSELAQPEPPIEADRWSAEHDADLMSRLRSPLIEAALERSGIRPGAAP